MLQNVHQKLLDVHVLCCCFFNKNLLRFIFARFSFVVEGLENTECSAALTSPSSFTNRNTRRSISVPLKHCPEPNSWAANQRQLYLASCLWDKKAKKSWNVSEAGGDPPLALTGNILMSIRLRFADKINFDKTKSTLSMCDFMSQPALPWLIRRGKLHTNMQILNSWPLMVRQGLRQTK